MSRHLPRHKKATAFASSGLFSGLSSFAELERRIEQLPTEQERGAAFEVFVEAYLNLDETVQASDVWVGGTVPPEVLRALNLTPNDYGYDGVFRTRTGELVTYQAKFRTNRSSLSYRELATFFGITEKADRRVLLTNSAGIAEVAESRSDFNAVRGIDFDRLNAEQLAQIAAWIEGAPAPVRVREPRPHQQAALDDIAKEFADHNRATVVMACGTGKTLVALWAAEQADPKRVLVLVPSLSLLRQTLHEWAQWTNWDERFRYLAVCSDPTVKGEDAIQVRSEDTDFPVRTDPAIVRQFLERAEDDAVSVVFCTYQSAPVVGEATKDIEPFDLGVFDEAHKTTGRAGTRYAFALRDEKLPIRKRLFMTATPRHYNIRKRDKEGEFAVTSMDDESIYGRVAHRLSFSEAADQKIIVPYKVVISVVDHKMIDNALLDQSEVIIQGDPTKAKWVAHQIAVKHAVEKHDARRIITFHSTVKAASAFASEGSEGVGFHLPQFDRFHVSGTQRTAVREGQMQEFASVARGLITNARCLTEGVDVPSVDMVAFMNPRKSQVDIVQAVGRAMRTSKEGNKTCGYVLVPLFLEVQQGETVREALERSDFAEIADVLNAMRDNDDELANIIQELSVEKGKTGGFDESRLREKIEVLGPEIGLDELTSSVRTLLMDDLGVTWDRRYGELIAYKNMHGDCNVPQGWKDNPSLGHWCNTQRMHYKNGKLSTELVARLERLGFEWSLRDPWEEVFAELTAFKQIHGHCNVSSKEGLKLGRWCSTQRKSYKRGTLPAERVAQLEQLGFEWDLLATGWEEKFAALVAYQQTHGDCNVPQKWKDNPELGTWCSNQRADFKRGRLSAERVARLDQIGFEWDVLAVEWEARFAELTAFKEIHGHCNVPAEWKDNLQLATWCATQRKSHNRGTLSSERIARLEEAGFVWDFKNARWEERFAALAAYKHVHGHCNVPSRWKDDPELGGWCSQQRKDYRKDALSPERMARLAQLGFELDPLTSQWEEMLAALMTYKQSHGHCNVPLRWPDNPKLGRWCINIRQLYKKNRLSPEQIAQLEEQGFVWDTKDAAWEEMFSALVAYRQAHGHCNLPKRWAANPRLGGWCQRQRVQHKRGELSAERVARLEQLGFEWERRTSKK